MSQEIKNKIIELLKNPNLEGEELVAKIEPLIAKLIPFDHSCKNIMEACHISDNIEMRVKGFANASETIEAIEKSVTKRKLSFVFFRKIIEEQGGEKAVQQITRTVDRSRRSSSQKPCDPKSFFDDLMDY